jgi:hypothetical protein
MNTFIRLPRPIAVEAASDYALTITFSNGEIRRFDAKPYLASYPAFAALKESGFFAKARVAHNTVR